MKVLAITATSGRHWCMERTLGMFLEQDYKDKSILLIYNNSDVSLELNLPQLDSTKEVILINQYKNRKTRLPYCSLGEIYQDCLDYINDLGISPDIVTHMDDDDIYMNCHLSEGVKGLLKGGVLAYKPKYSYYRDSKGIHLVENTLEPSIFVKYSHLKSFGYNETNVDLHHKWLNPLVENKNIYIDNKGKATFIYDWNVEVPVWKTSGDPYNPENFNNYKKTSKDHGDGILTPFSHDMLKKYYI